jgi:hypothetical protein
MTTTLIVCITAVLAFCAGIITVRLIDLKRHHRQQAAALRSWHRYTDLRPR